jgi:membrane-bound ClpP family serine protease
MNKGTGTGLIGLGIVLMVVGAIMRFAVKVKTSGFNIHTAGVIILIAGGVIFLLGLAALLYAGRNRTTTVREDIHTTPTGQERIEERQDPSGF